MVIHGNGDGPIPIPIPSIERKRLLEILIITRTNIITRTKIITTISDIIIRIIRSITLKRKQSFLPPFMLSSVVSYYATKYIVHFLPDIATVKGERMVFKNSILIYVGVTDCRSVLS